MIRARLNYTTDGKTTVVIGLSTPDLDLAMIEERPIAMSLEDLGIDLNIVVIARATDEDCVRVLSKATSDKGDLLVVDKRNEKGMVERALARGLTREEKHEVQRAMNRRKKRR